ncbi:MAG: hypothetical protein IJB06_06010 [Bacteroidales bacterium]|nr:hypothetical protein [Bacteroidales bacterium]
MIIVLLCLTAVNAAVSCKGYDDYVKNLKYEYGYTVKKHNVKGSDIEAIEQALDKHEWQKYKQLTKDEAKAEWESFLSDINDEEVEITDGGYVTVRLHELVSMTIDDIIHWVEGDSVGEKTWK